MENNEKRRILLCVTGLSPQIVTETLYALACGEQPWVPDEIHLVTTQTGAENARLNLLLGAAWFHRLCEDYHLPQIDFTEKNIHVPLDAAGKPLDDIRTPEDNSLVADFITERVRLLTECNETELHVSMAGGRKTMGYYLGYALSLYGRPQDRLSHVLVSDPYESNRDFYYPTPYDQPIHVLRGGKEITVDAKNAKVDMAEIPFVRLREGLHPRLKEGQASFSKAIAMANRTQAAPKLILDITAKKVWMDDETIELSPTKFLVYCWLANRLLQGTPLTAWSDDVMGDEFIQFADEHLIKADKRRDEIRKSIDARKGSAKGEVLAKYFEPHSNRINVSIKEKLGDVGVQCYAIQSKKEGGVSKYYLPLEPEQIAILGRKHHMRIV